MIRIPDQIKRLFTTDNVRKNFRVIFPNGEFPDMVNDKIENESVMLTESISSQSVIQFGLCESPMIEFVCHGMPNFTRKTIKCQLEVDISSLSAEDIAQYGQTSPDVPYPYYVIPYGTYIVKECKKSGDSDKRKVVGYSKLTYMSWAFPEDAFWFVKNTGWYENYTLNLSFNELLMLYSPSIMEEDFTEVSATIYNRSDNNGLLDINGVIKANLYNNSVDNHRYILRIDFLNYNSSLDLQNLRTFDGIIRIKTQYDVNVFTNAIKDINDYLKRNVSDNTYIEILNSYAGEPVYHFSTMPYTYVRYDKYGQYGEYATRYIDNPYDTNYKEKKWDVLKKNDFTVIFQKRYENFYSGSGDAYSHQYCLLDNARNSFYNYYDSNTDTFITKDMTPILIRIPYKIRIEEYKNGSYELVYEKELSILPKVLKAYHSLTNENTYISFDGASKTLKYRRRDFTADPESTVIYYSDVNKTVYTVDTSINNYLASLGDYRLNYRDFIQSTLELQGKFGMIDRTTGDLKIIDLTDHLMLYPSPDIYPSQDLYPRGSELLITRSMYKLVEYEDSATRHYDRISCTWTDSSNNEHYQYYDIVDHDDPSYDPDDYQTYSLSENYFIKNKYYTVAQVTEILHTLGEKIKGFQYFPCDIECVGLPYVETGDGISVVTKDSGFTSFVLRRTIKGIQSLEDNIEAR